MEPSMICDEQQQQQHPPSTEDRVESDGSTMDDSFPGELEPRGRCYTWPVPQFSTALAPSAVVAQATQHILVDDTCLNTTSSQFPSLSNFIGTEAHVRSCSSAALPNDNLCFISQQTSTDNPSGNFQSHFSHHLTLGVQPQSSTSQQASDALATTKLKPKRVRRRTADGVPGNVQPHKKPNPWGEESYSDLIARALSCACDGRLKLNEIYQWFSDNIPYFAQRSSQEEAQGWKNSIRHNLSLHSRFMRIQNEGAGKSSWWVINPDAKPGRNPRRRANTMEAATKTSIDKKRRGARKRVEGLVQQKGTGGPCTSMASVLSSQHDLFPGDECDAMDGGGRAAPGSSTIVGSNFDTFRPRAQSTLSVTGPASRLSPTLESSGFDDFHFPSWMDEQSGTVGPSTPQSKQLNGSAQQQNGATKSGTTVNELLDRTDQIRLESAEHKHILNGNIKLEIGVPPQPIPPQPQPSVSNVTPLLVPKNEIGDLPQIKDIPPPPSYQELSVVRRPAQMQTNPLLRQLGGNPTGMAPSPPQMMKIGNSTIASVLAQQPAQSNMFIPVSQPIGTGNFQPTTSGLWMPTMSNPTDPHPLVSTSSIGQHFQWPNLNMGPGGGALPLDLENVNAMSVDQSLLSELDVDAVLRHELAQGGQFDLP